MKVKYSKFKGSSHGGLVPIVKEIRDRRIPQLIRKILPKRVNQAKFKFDDIIIAWILSLYCGGQKIEQITKIKKHFAIFPDMKVPSHDTIGRAMKMLGKYYGTKTPRYHITEKIIRGDIQDNLLLNELLILMAIRIGILKGNREYTLHIDCTVIETLRGESKFSYLQHYGYAPCVCAIDNCPIFVSMRNGNVQAAHQISTCLDQCLQLLEKYNIKVKKVISDSAGYNRDVMEVVHRHSVKILTVPKKHFSTMLNIDDCEDWKPTRIETTNSIWECEIGQTPFYMNTAQLPLSMIMVRFKPKEVIKQEKDPEYRQYIKRKMDRLRDNNKLKKQKTTIRAMGRSYNGYEYKLFVTNDFLTPLEDQVKEYLKRGKFEQTFSALKQNYGWSYPPFYDLSGNSIFLIICSMANVLMKGLLRLFNDKIPFIRTTMTLSEFKMVFINVVCLLVNRHYQYSIDTEIPYHLLL